MLRGYSAYTNYSGDLNNNLYVSAVVDGSAGFNFPGAYHTGKVSITIRGTTTTVAGNPTPPNAYLSVSNAATLTDVQPGDDVQESTVQTITCNFAGTFFAFQRVRRLSASG
jgi:hypothetical protein